MRCISQYIWSLIKLFLLIFGFKNVEIKELIKFFGIFVENILYFLNKQLLISIIII